MRSSRTFTRRFESRLALLAIALSSLSFSAASTAETHARRRQQQQQQQQPAGHDHASHQQPQPRYSRTVDSYEPPDVTLVDAGGAKVRLLSALKHEGPVMLQFIFTTCPSVCPVMSSTFSASQGKLGDDLDKLRMISISIDPEYDTPERLQEYARKFKAGRQWTFLTGRLDDVVAVQKAFDNYRGNKMRHEPVTFLRASPAGRWVRLNGLMTASDLVAEYRGLTAR